MQMKTDKYNFDKVIPRYGTGSEKWDSCDRLFGGEDLLPMWVADMDFQSPPEVIESLKRVSLHGIFGYSTYLDKTYDSVINWFSRRYDWNIDRDSIVFSPGVVAGISFLIQSLTNEGDGIIIQPPVYYPFSKLIEGNGRKIVNNPLQERDDRYEMDFDKLEIICSEESVKMFILSSPHNPVGRVWSKNELIDLLKICRRHGIIIISDEIHCDLTLNENRHIPLETLAKEEDIIITCTSPSKTFNMAGCKTSNIIIGNKDIRDRFNTTVLRNGCADPNPFGIAAMEAAYNHGEEWLSELKKYLEGNLELIRGEIESKLPSVKLTEPEATYLAWLDFGKTGISWEEQDRLFIDTARVAPDSGHIFGEEGRGFQRINFACPKPLLKEGLERIIKTFSQYI